MNMLSPLSLILGLALTWLSFASFSQGSGNTLTFNGSTQYVDIGNQVGNGCRTIEAWFKPNLNIVSTLNDPKSLVMRDFNGGSGQNTDEFGLYFAPNNWQGGVNAGKLVFMRRIGTTLIQIASDNNFWEANHWYHVCGTIDPVTGMKLYINGVLQQENHPSTSAIGTQSSAPTDRVSIGKWGDLNIRYFNGEIDEVRLWETERTQQEIRDKMCSSLFGNELGLRAYWKFDLGMGSVLTDNSLNSFDGTLQFMTNANWVYSGAPIGNISTHSYPGNLSGTSTILTTGVGDEFTIDNVNSTAQGVQLYKVNSLPNVISGLSSPTTNNYYGVFLTSTNGTYNVSYDYNAYGCSSCDEIFSRNDNAVLNWSQIVSNPVNCTFNLTNESSFGYDYRAEYIINSLGSNIQNPLGNDTTLCVGSNLVLTPQAPNSTFLWQDNSTMSTYTVTQPGTFWVEITNNCGTFIDSIIVDFTNPPSFSLGNDTVICQSASILLAPGLTGVTYNWQDNSTMSTYTAAQSGVYWVEVTNNCGTFIDSIFVDFANPPSFSFGNDTILCQNANILLDPGLTGVTYNWQDNSTMPSYTASQPGVYWVEVTNNCGTFIDSIFVDFENPPSFSLGNDTVLCQATSILLNPGLSSVTYNWQDNSTNSTFLVTQSGIYSLEVSNVCGSASDTIQIGISSPPSISLGADTAICAGNSLVLSATNAQSNYEWQDGSSNSTFDVSQPGQYWVEVSNACGFDSDTIEIDVITIPDLNFGNDTSICEGTTLILQSSVINGNIIWQDGSSSPLYAVDQTGLYSGLVFINGCTTYDTILVDVILPPSVELGNDTLVCEGENFILSPNSLGIGSYEWNTGITESAIVVNSFGEYSLTLTNQCGSATDSIIVQDLDCSCSYYIPNTFTPDGGEANDEFGVIYDCSFYSFNIEIYNRWGELIFENSDPNSFWDGTFKGKLVQVGTYTYKVNLQTSKGNVKTISGHVNVIY